MHTADIESLKNAAYANKLRPVGKQNLGEHVQVWACELRGHHARKTDKFLTLDEMTFFNGEQEIKLLPADLPAPGKSGLSVPDFVAALWAKLPDVTQKTRVILATFGSAENYGVLDVHDLNPDISYYPAGGDSFSLKYNQGPYNLEFMDLAVWFPESDLTEVEQSLGLIPQIDNSKRVYGVLAALRGIIRESFDVDICRYRTPAATAARIYVSQHLRAAPGGERGTPKMIRTQAMLSYWGGRAEAFARGRFDGEFSLYDAVSLYPNAVINLGKLPTVTDWYRLTDADLDTCHAGICTVEFDFREIDPETGEIVGVELHPCLPVPLAGKTVYPTHGVSHCTVHEARYAREIGGRVTVLTGYAYDAGDGDSTLAEYSRALLSMKQTAEDAGNRAERTAYKLLLNSLYGKFGQHRVGYDLNVQRAACRVLGLPNLAVLDKIPNWPEMAAEAGLAVEQEIMVGGQWCPEWAALIQGYARYIESRAMRDYVALVGTTDSVLIAGDAGPQFEIDGIVFKRECQGQRAVIVRSRLYVLASRPPEKKAWDIEKAALHGCPRVRLMPEKILYWRNDDAIKIDAVRVRKLRDGLFSGDAVGAKLGGKKQTVTYTVSMDWDGKRLPVGDYSLPLDTVETSD